MNYEFIGIAGTALILIAFMCNSEAHIRLLDAAGAALFVVYGILIHSPSNIILNGILIAIQFYKLVRLEGRGK